MLTCLLAYYASDRPIIGTPTVKSGCLLTLILFSLDEVVTSIDPIKVLKERLMHKDKIFIHLKVLSALFFKDAFVKLLIVDVVR